MKKLNETTQKKKGWSRLAGEISDLRNRFWGNNGVGGVKGKLDQYTLNSTKTDYKLARELYYNTNDNYKLGAGLLKPIIDTTVGFIGIPSWKLPDNTSQSLLDNFSSNNKAILQDIIRNTIRDGDCYARLSRRSVNVMELYPEDNIQIEVNIIPAEGVSILIDPLTGNSNGFQITTPMSYVDFNGTEHKYDIVELVRADTITTYYEGNDVPNEIKEFNSDNPRITDNIWGFVNIIHFKNDSEAIDLYGTSELEPAEPYIKAYHDVMMNSMINNKLHSAPKLIMNVQDVSEFMRLNFGIDTDNLVEGQTQSINLEGTDMLITSNAEDKIELVQATSTMTDSATLLKFLFMSLVDVTQTPEFVFGNAVNSSKASVKEQMTPMIKKVTRKRAMFDPYFRIMARMFLLMTSKSDLTNDLALTDNFSNEIKWPQIIERDVMTESTAIVQLVNAFKIGIENKFISVETCIDYLSSVIDVMGKYNSDEASELDRVKKGIAELNAIENLIPPTEGKSNNSEDGEDPTTVADMREKARDAKRNQT